MSELDLKNKTLKEIIMTLKWNSQRDGEGMEWHFLEVHIMQDENHLQLDLISNNTKVKCA